MQPGIQISSHETNYKHMMHSGGSHPEKRFCERRAGDARLQIHTRICRTARSYNLGNCNFRVYNFDSYYLQVTGWYGGRIMLRDYLGPIPEGYYRAILELYNWPLTTQYVAASV